MVDAVASVRPSASISRVDYEVAGAVLDYVASIHGSRAADRGEVLGSRKSAPSSACPLKLPRSINVHGSRGGPVALRPPAVVATCPSRQLPRGVHSIELTSQVRGPSAHAFGVNLELRPPACFSGRPVGGGGAAERAWRRGAGHTLSFTGPLRPPPSILCPLPSTRDEPT